MAVCFLGSASTPRTSLGAKRKFDVGLSKSKMVPMKQPLTIEFRSTSICFLVQTKSRCKSGMTSFPVLT
jgi:hypothetical protein